MPVSADVVKGLTAAPYSRVSKAGKGREGRSTGQQDQENLATCDRYGWPVLRVFSDDDRSASKYARKDREDWQELVTAVTAGHARVIVVWEPSRATRDRQVWAALAYVCEEKHVYICASGTVYDPTDPDDMFQLDLYFALSTRESGVTRKRIMRDIRLNAAAGRPHGKLTYGYRREYDVSLGGEKKYLRQVPHSGTASVVRRIFRLYLNGRGCTTIAKLLNGEGVPAPRGAAEWRASTVRRILVCQTYIGNRTLNGEVVVEGAWKALIEPGEFWRVQAKLNDPDSGRVAYDGTRAKTVLSGIPLCVPCGNGNRLYQTPRGIIQCPACSRIGRKAAPIEEFVVERALALLEGDGRVQADDDDPRIGEAMAELAALETRLNSFIDSAGEADGPTPAALARIEAKIRPQIASKQRELDRLRSWIALPDLDVPIREAWYGEVLDLEEKRRIIRSTVRVSVDRIGKNLPVIYPPRGVIVEPLWGLTDPA
jgi:site-specific DNA recombinase